MIVKEQQEHIHSQSMRNDMMFRTCLYGKKLELFRETLTHLMGKSDER